MISTSLLMARLALAWYLVALLAYAVVVELWSPLGIAAALLGCVAVVFALLRGYGHIRRLRLLGYTPSGETLGNRHRRQIELPMAADESFALTEAIIGEFTRSGTLVSDRGALRLRTQVGHLGQLAESAWRHPLGWFVSLRNQVLATLVPGDGTTSVVLICEPQRAAWSDWFRIDDAANLETAEAITHALTRRVADRRHAEQQAVAQTVTEKELAIAKLRLLQAQVEPHFLYNTLASAQVLTRSDPARAETMLGHLIDYLRRSLPRTDHALSSLGEELQRSRAYLDIMQLRMGDRLALKIDVADTLLATPLPPMMLQTLVENAIKHGLEPKTDGGCVYISARHDDGRVAVTVADDGCGFDASGVGHGIGLHNVRERLRLVYGQAASLSVAANLPHGVAATISVPQEATHA